MQQVITKTRPMDVDGVRSEPLRILLNGLIDYAGLFPPAKLNMQSAVQNYAEYSQGEYKWILGRFIVAVTRLGEFESAVSELRDGIQPTRWQLSALAGQDVASDVAQILDFNRRHAQASLPITITSLEVKTSQLEDISRLHKMIPTEMTAFFEIPISGSTREYIVQLAECRRNAKLRLGGETPAMIPNPADVAEFIKYCADAKLPFKATAGLHHPVRSAHRLTYAPDSPSGTMHGFFNVFLAAAFLQNGMDVEEAAELLKEESPAAFSFDAHGAGWRAHQLNSEHISGSRERFALSFGSCSFVEPMEDLRTQFSL